MEKLLEGRVAIITGGSRGIGRATALLVAREGADLVIGGRKEAELKAVREEITAGTGRRCVCVAGSVEEKDNPSQLVEAALSAFGRLDILVCSAGMNTREKSLDMPRQDWDRVMDVNLTAPMELSRACIRHFLTQDKGKIVYVASNAVHHVALGTAPSYGASKAGLVYLARHFAKEYARDHIYVNAVLPGPVETELIANWTPEHRAREEANLPLGRMGTPEDIANCILFLASDMSDYVTGASLAANGGRDMY